MHVHNSKRHVQNLPAGNNNYLSYSIHPSNEISDRLIVHIALQRQYNFLAHKGHLLFEKAP